MSEWMNTLVMKISEIKANLGLARYLFYRSYRLEKSQRHARLRPKTGSRWTWMEIIGTECRLQRQRYGKSISQPHAGLSSICIWLQETTLSLLPASPRAAQESAMGLPPQCAWQAKTIWYFHNWLAWVVSQAEIPWEQAVFQLLVQMSLKYVQCYNTALLFTQFTFKDLGLQVRERVQ